MESDRTKQLHRVNKLKLQGHPQEYEDSQTFVRKHNIVEKSTKTETTERNPTLNQQRLNNARHSRFLDVDKESYISQSNRKYMDNKQYETTDKLHQQKMSKHTKLIDNTFPNSISSNRNDGKRYDENKQYRINSYNHKDDSTNQDNCKTQVSFNDQTNKKLYQQSNFESLSKPNKTRLLQVTGTDDTSLICRAINFHGEPVIVNDKVITNKLIMSCKPRRYPQDVSVTPKVSIGKNQSVEENVTNYVYPIDNITSTKGSKNRDSLYSTNKLKNNNNQPETSITNENLVKLSDTLYLTGNKGVTYNSNRAFNDYYIQHHFKDEECKHMYRKFKSCLWALFGDNILLTIIGMALTVIALHYILFRDYLSIVVGEIGLVTWVWIMLFIAIIIIIVGTVGMIAALVSNKPMLKTYLVLAVILLAILLLVVVVFMGQYSILKNGVISESERTFHLYRCMRRIRVAWDTMMEEFKCCGKKSSHDWKYVPTACCNATSRAGKLACIGHFIQPSQAWEEGCNDYMQQYYYILFINSFILLAIAIILLIIGIICGFTAHYMYDDVINCKELYFIT